MKTKSKSTYAMLVQSEENGRTLAEGAAYLLCVMCSVFSIWQAAQQPIDLPSGAVLQRANVVQTAPVQNRV